MTIPGGNTHTQFRDKTFSPQKKRGEKFTGPCLDVDRAKIVLSNRYGATLSTRTNHLARSLPGTNRLKPNTDEQVSKAEFVEMQSHLALINKKKTINDRHEDRRFYQIFQEHIIEILRMIKR